MSRLVIAAGIVTAVVMGGSAAATPPATFDIHEEFALPIADCGGRFQVVEEVVLHISGKVFFDRDGDFAGGLAHLRWRGALTRPGDPAARSLRDDGSWQEDFTNDPFVKLTGNVAHFTIPGHGVVVLSAGTAVVDFSGSEPIIVESTPAHTNPEVEFASAEVQEAICSYFE